MVSLAQQDNYHRLTEHGEHGTSFYKDTGHVFDHEPGMDDYHHDREHFSEEIAHQEYYDKGMHQVFLESQDQGEENWTHEIDHVRREAWRRLKEAERAEA